MPVSFDWDFKEPDLHGEGDDGGLTDRRRRRFLRAGLLLILLAIVGVAAGAWIKSRLNAVEKVEAELRSAVELELKTIQDGDAELYRSRQDPGDARWEARQFARYITTSDSFAPAPGLIPADRPLEIKQVHLLGRTGRAELTQWFSAPTQQPAASLPFHVTWFYRQGGDGVWYHIAPPGDYWGIPYSWYGSRLVVRATEVESEVLDPIARDLAVLVIEGCRRVGCAEGLRYNLSFEGELAPRVQDNWWTLPALYLTGLPEGDEARAAWEGALKLWVVEALAQSQTGDGELSNRVIFRQLVKHLQVELDLREDSAAEPTTSDVNLLAEALRNGRRPGFQSLWEARYGVSDPEDVRLLETEVVLFLQWIEVQVGDERLYELLPALSAYDQLDTALLATYRLAPSDFEAEWRAYLFYVTGVTPSSTALPQASAQRLSPPPNTHPAAISPGDQIAFICENRVWVGNGDGSNLVPLTTRDGGFVGLHWSPDGRRLLTAWLPDLSPALPRSFSERRALYLLTADGSGGRLLTEDPTLSPWPIGWSPDGHQAIYHTWYGEADGALETWAVEVGTGETQRLPGVPMWSPDGNHLMYVSDPSSVGGTPVWLADANWENPRQIAERGRIWPGPAWSPRSTKLAYSLVDDDLSAKVVVVYDLLTESVAPLITAADLTETVLASEGDFVSDGIDPCLLIGRPLQSLQSAGWSADGSQLLVGAQAFGGPVVTATAPTVLAAVPLNGSPPRVLICGRGAFLTGASWSPAGSDRLAIVWLTQSRQFESPNVYLFDLKAGPIYTATESWDASWSPDGAWVAFSGQEQVTIVDERGQVRFALGKEGSCSSAVWNPVADLSDLGATPPLVSSTSGWSFANVHVYQDSEAQALHVWGELVNYTGSDQRLLELIAVIHDDEGNLIVADQEVVSASSFGDLIRTVSLAEGRSLPFGLSLRLPGDVTVENDYSVVVTVEAEPGEPTRDDLDIPYDDYDLSGWPDYVQVSGLFEIPGQPLEEYLTIVVTVYDEDGRVSGWGWSRRTDDRYLMSGGHYFEVEVPAADFVSELDLEVESYKVQLFGR